MKKILLFVILIFTFSCSVDNEKISEPEILTADVITSVDGCSVYDLNFAEEAVFKIRNFHDYIEITVTNIGEKDFNNLSVHFANNENDFPRTGKGELNSSKFYYSENIDKGKKEITISFDFYELGLAIGDEILIAAIAEFGSGKNKTEILATDEVLTGDNFYFEYYVEDFSNYAGTDQIREITLSEARALPSWDEVRKTYANMLDEGVNKKEGVYSPSIWDLIYDFNDPNRTTQLGDYITTYTLGTGDCSDSTRLTLRVVADPL